MNIKQRVISIDWKKWGKNTALFLAPAMIVFLSVLQADGTLDEAMVALKLWGLNVAIDLLRKFMATNK